MFTNAEPSSFRSEFVIDKLPMSILITDKNLNIQIVNLPLFRQLQQANSQLEDRDQLLGTNFNAFFSTEWQEKLATVTEQVKTTKQAGVLEHPHFSDQERTLGWTIQPLFDPTNTNILGFAFQGTDITEKIIARNRLEKEAIYDPLTGAYNRNFLERYLSILSSGHYSLGLVNIDLDGLKTTNDKEGHLAGDEALRNVHTLLKNSFRETDIVARMGEKGDEFNIVVFSENLTQEALEERIKILQENIENFNENNPDHPISISFGYAFIPRNIFNTNNSEYNQTLINQARESADAQMYKQKKAKKDQANHQAKTMRPPKKFGVKSPQSQQDLIDYYI